MERTVRFLCLEKTCPPPLCPLWATPQRTQFLCFADEPDGAQPGSEDFGKLLADRLSVALFFYQAVDITVGTVEIAARGGANGVDDIAGALLANILGELHTHVGIIAW
jgi:hypothetical protein